MFHWKTSNEATNNLSMMEIPQLRKMTKNDENARPQH